MNSLVESLFIHLFAIAQAIANDTVLLVNTNLVAICKKIRNTIYRVCGVGMVASFLILLLPNFSCKVWLMETIALFFFGVSFLTKADIYPWLFCDTPYKD